MAKGTFVTEIDNSPIAAYQSTYAEKDSYGVDIHDALSRKADQTDIPSAYVASAAVSGNTLTLSPNTGNPVEYTPDTGKIDSITVNGGSALPISEKNVDIPLASGNTAGAITGADKTRWDSWSSGSYNIPLYSVNIGGRYYPITKIGNQLWTTENLDWKYPGLTIGFSDPWIDCADYLDGDESTYGVNGLKYGLRYVWSCVETINSLLSDGWHVPTRNDVLALTNTVGAENGGTKLKSTSGWENDGNGSNESGFNALPSGYFYPGSGEYAGKAFEAWTTTDLDGMLKYTLHIGTGASISSTVDFYQNVLIPLAIRLVKNLA